DGLRGAHPTEVHCSDLAQAPVNLKWGPRLQFRGFGKGPPNLFRRVTQFSHEYERPLVSVLLYLHPGGGTWCVLLLVDHLLLLLVRDFSWCCWLIHAIEMAFEGIDVSGPEPAEGIQPGIDFLKWLRFQPVQATLRVHSGFHEASLSQHSQM